MKHLILFALLATLASAAPARLADALAARHSARPTAHHPLDQAPRGFQHHARNVHGLDIHYVDNGRSSAPTVVLIAGYPQTWYAWRRVMPALASHYRVIAVDLPGQGRSDKPSSGYDTGALGDVVDELTRALGVQRYHLVGHDVGAWVAFTQAGRHGGAVRSLTLLDAGIPGVTLPEALPIAPDKSWRTWQFSFNNIPELPELLLKGHERAYLDWFLRKKAADPRTFSERDLDVYQRAFTAPGALHGGLGYYRAIPLSARQNQEIVERGKLMMPVLGVSASKGSIPDMATPLRKVADRVEGVIIEGSGHFIPEEQPAALARALVRFIDDAEGR